MKRDYIDFQDQSYPLAYLISFRCYGTWLHGDERGSVNRKNHNLYGTDKLPASLKLIEIESYQLKNQPMHLDHYQRPIVEKAIRDVCEYRNYKLFAAQARTNHVHTVVFGKDAPEKIMNSFKSYATRHLRTGNLIKPDVKIWSRHGSTRYLWTEKQIEVAVDYVMNGQGKELPSFE